jgi:hypothetical protein
MDEVGAGLAMPFAHRAGSAVRDEATRQLKVTETSANSMMDVFNSFAGIDTI